LVIHAENPRAQTADRTLRYIEACGMIRAPHPPDFPDRGPSDFFRFNYLNNGLQRQHFETGEELLAEIRDLLSTIEKVTLERVFLEWMDHVGKL
jgi:hypothetical protein